MRYGLAFSLAAALTMTPAIAAVQNATLWMSGTFDSSFGAVKLTPAGGSYGNGGTLKVEGIQGSQMWGTWRQTTGGQRCRDGGYWGKFLFRFTATGFTGNFGYCYAEASQPWSGTRVGPAPATRGPGTGRGGPGRGPGGGGPGGGGPVTPANTDWGVWAYRAIGNDWNDPCSIQYVGAPVAGNRYDSNASYRRVRTRPTQRLADLDIDHFGRFHRDQPDDVVKMRSCKSDDTGTGRTVPPSANVPSINGSWRGPGGKVYVIAQNDYSFNWARLGTNEKGSGSINGRSLSGSLSGTIVFDSDGKPIRIILSNGETISR